MANISITGKCNRECNYCFAMDSLNDHGVDEMTLDTFSETLDMLAASHILEARILGGEPTLHHQFETMLDMCLERNIKLLVFSGGLIPQKIVHKLHSIPSSKVSVLINAMYPEESKGTQLSKQQAVCEKLGEKVILGANVDSPRVQLDFLLDMISQYHLAPVVRLGIAHPMLHGGNSYLHPRHYKEAGKRIARFAFLAAERDIDIEFDCGFVPCMFPDDALNRLGKGPWDVGLRCNPIIDILPTGKVISCYPLARHHQSNLTEFNNIQEMRDNFSQLQSNDRTITLYRKCKQCDWYQQGGCTGGCLSASMRRQRSSSSEISVSFEPASFSKAQ